MVYNELEDDLYDDPSGKVVCWRHAERATDIWRWQRLTDEDAADWRLFIRNSYGADASPCEDCRVEAGFYRR